MKAGLATAGERLLVESELGWVDSLVRGAAGPELEPSTAGASVSVRISASDAAHDTKGWEPLDRGAWQRAGEVIMRDVVGTGFDLRASTSASGATFEYRWRPPARSRLANTVMRTRFVLLARAALLQYPAMWWAGTRGRAPLHASVCAAAGGAPLLVGAAGVGKSTLVDAEVAAGGTATSDNLCISDGVTAWGVVEPARLPGGGERGTTHGRHEAWLARRVPALVPDRIVILRRGESERASVRPVDAEEAQRMLLAGTYMAGELRRYWGFAATLSAGTGVGPVHPPIAEVARRLGGRLPAVELSLARRPGARLAGMLETLEAIA